MSTDADPAGRSLRGRSIVVTRPRPGHLDAALTAHGATVVSAATITFGPADDQGHALVEASGKLAERAYDWLVVTSATAVDFLMATPTGAAALQGARVAAVGPATARAVVDAGGTVELVPTRAVGEALAEAFPEGSGKVVVLRPEVARVVVGDGVAARGWDVDEVVAYRTVPRAVSPEAIAATVEADAVTFTSPSTVVGLAEALSIDDWPGVVVSIGPVTSEQLRVIGVEAIVEADPHTADGIVEALLDTFNPC